jgi:hypothetical protein
MAGCSKAHRGQSVAEPDKQWRIDNAGNLKGLQLQFLQYAKPSEQWDHDHCAACWTKFAEFDGPDILHEGYATRHDYPKGARYEWVCQRCFDDLRDEMQWSATSE